MAHATFQAGDLAAVTRPSAQSRTSTQAPPARHFRRQRYAG
jgi:hypothetical protein